MLRANNVCKKFNDSLVLNDINIAVEKGSIVGLAGPSGSGKTTLLRCMQNLETIDSGTIEYNGQTGFMFQDFQLFPHMTVLRNLVYAPALLNKTKSHDAQAMSILANLGIADKAEVYPDKLSGGQKQRVALARSLMMHPELLLCDEPTSGLDVATTLDVVSLLESVRSMGVTMIIASHDLDFLTKIADRIVLLKNGKIIIDVAPKTLDDPIYYLKNYY
jgi:polar amino acid transport system ATP-binding protein